MRHTFFIEELYAYFIEEFLSAFANQDAKLIAELEHCRCSVEFDGTKLRAEFYLANLFDALWRTAALNGVDLSHDSDWNKDFKKFCTHLMFPWSETERRLGVKITLMHKSNSHARSRYALSTT